MSGYNNDELITAICEGTGRRFGGVPCRFYRRSDSVCVLLETQRMEEWWNQNRCGYAILNIIEEHCVKMIETFYDVAIVRPVDYDLISLVTRLKKPRELKKGCTLTVWHNYIHTAVYKEIGKKLGCIPDKKRCGTCKHLSKSPGYVCVKKGTIRTKRDGVCDKSDYCPKEIPSGKTRQPSCATCSHLSRKTYFCYNNAEPRKKGDPICEAYSPNICEQPISIDAPDYPDGSDADQLLKKIAEARDRVAKTPEAIVIRQEMHCTALSKVLGQRIERTAPGSKEREIRERQYDMFINLLHLFEEDDNLTEDDAIETLAKVYHLEKWTLNRDVKDVREFLKKCS